MSSFKWWSDDLYFLSLSAFSRLRHFISMFPSTTILCDIFQWITMKCSFTSRNAPTSLDTTTTTTSSTNYHWPPSPVLPSISRRTPHLVPEHLMPAVATSSFDYFTAPQLNANQNESHNNTSTSATQNANHRASSWTWIVWQWWIIQ